jgi:hypothetical protein
LRSHTYVSEFKLQDWYVREFKLQDWRVGWQLS